MPKPSSAPFLVLSLAWLRHSTCAIAWVGSRPAVRRGIVNRLDREPTSLTAAEIAQLTAQLHIHHDRLVGSLERGADGTKPVDLDEPIGRLSRIDALAQREMNDAGRRAQLQELTQVKLALEAMDAGEYGLCRACDEPIAFRRLLARPFATICVRCKSERERR